MVLGFYLIKWACAKTELLRCLGTYSWLWMNVGSLFSLITPPHLPSQSQGLLLSISKEVMRNCVRKNRVYAKHEKYPFGTRCDHVVRLMKC